MKWTLATALCMPLCAAGQITITADDLPQPGTTYPLVDIAPPVLADLEASGSNAVWDFSAVVPLGDASQTPQPMSAASATAMFVFNNPFNSSYQCDFFLPTSLPDFGVDLSGIIPVDGFSNFYKTDGNMFTLAGLALGAAGFDVPVPYSDRDELFPLPLEAGMTHSSTSYLALDIPETFGYWSAGQRDVVVDGWGTLTLPDGDHEVLRVRSEIAASDSIFIPQIGTPFAFERSQVVYQWYGQGHGFPLLEVTALFGIPTTARYLDLASNSSGTEGLAKAVNAVYPNPVRSSASLSFTASVGMDYAVLNAQGRVLQSGTCSASPMRVQAPSVPGIYFIQTPDNVLRFAVE